MLEQNFNGLLCLDKAAAGNLQNGHIDVGLVWVGTVGKQPRNRFGLAGTGSSVNRGACVNAAVFGDGSPSGISTHPD